MQEQLQREPKPIAAFILSLLAGLWMFSMGGMMSGFQWGPGNLGHMGGMMHHRMWSYGLVNSVWWPWVGLVTGIAVLMSAIMLYTRPLRSKDWGVLILIASGINLLVGMGGILASVLGIIGGALAVSWQPQS